MGDLSIYSQRASTFDGVNERVQMGDVLGFERTNSFSAWAWIKTTSTATGDVISKMTTDANGRGWTFVLDTATNGMAVLLRNQAGNRILVNADPAINDGEWHLVAFTYDGSSTAAGVTIYYDGIPVAVTVNEDTLSATIVAASTFTVGARNNTSTFFTGTIDEPGVAATELTQAQILELWNGGVPQAVTGLSFYGAITGAGDSWRAGDGDNATTWFSVPGNNNGTLVNMNTANYVTDVPFRSFLNVLSLVFDGTNDWVDFGDVHDFERTDSFSIEFWFRTSTAALQALVAKGDVGATAGYEVSLDASGSVHFFATNTAGGTNELNVRTTATGFDDGAWHHCCVTYNGTSAPSGVHIYVDSSDEALTTVSNTLSASILNNDALRFGARSDGADRLTGNMVQVGFYDAVLTQTQVDELYDHGPVDKARVSSWASNVGYWHLGACDTGSAGALTTTLDRNLLAGNNGTTAGSPVVDADVPVGGVNRFGGLALVLDGTSQYINCGDVANFQFERTDAFSLECWFKPPTSVTGTDVIVAKADGASPFQGYRVFLDTSERINIELTSTGTNRIVVQGPSGQFGSSPTNVNWHHLVVTYDGSSVASGVTLYVNSFNIPLTTVADTLTTSILHAVSLQWGAQEATNFFPGLLDDCAVYDVELTQAQVAVHYNGGRAGNRSLYSTAANLVGWWPIGNGDSGDGTLICDYSHNSHNHGTLTGTGVGSGLLTADSPPFAASESRAPSFESLGAEVTQRDDVASGTSLFTATTEATSGQNPSPSYATLGMERAALENDTPSLLRPSFGVVEGPAGIPGGGGGPGVTEFFLMRGIDDGTSDYTTWVVTGAPDPNGGFANAGNTTPTLVGNIVAGSGIVLVAWQQ